MDDILYMRRCLELAAIGREWVAPNPMVGAILVSDDGRVLAEGWHRKYGGPHAEVNCFADADKRGVTEDEVHRATMYVSLEPCSHYGKTPPCALLLQQRHPKRVVCGTMDPNPKVAGRGIAMLQEVGIEVTVGVCVDECRELNKRFLTLQEKKRPYVILKWAQTADGYIDNRSATDKPADGPLVISTELTKQLVHQLRAENMAILVGSRTALMDNPRLKTTRWTGRNPIRILLDRHGIVPATHTIFADADEPSDYMPTVPRTIVYRERTDWPYVLADLGERNIHSLIIEGGAAVLESALESGLYDEVHVEVNPNLNAGQGTPAPAFALEEQPYTITDGNRIYCLTHQSADRQ